MNHNTKQLSSRQDALITLFCDSQMQFSMQSNMHAVLLLLDRASLKCMPLYSIRPSSLFSHLSTGHFRSVGSEIWFRFSLFMYLISFWEISQNSHECQWQSGLVLYQEVTAKIRRLYQIQVGHLIWPFQPKFISVTIDDISSCPDVYLQAGQEIINLKAGSGYKVLWSS